MAKPTKTSSSPSSSSTTNNNETNWGMGFLLVFFHHNLEQNNHPSSSSSSPFSLKNGNYNNVLVSKTQSTLCLCAFLVFSTLLFFTISSFEPTSTIKHDSSSRRVLRQSYHNTPSRKYATPAALQGMGEVYRRGSKAMSDLVVGHVAEGAEEREFGSFLRLVHHSGVLARADLVLLFESPDSASRLGRVVRFESDAFLRLLGLYKLNVSGQGRAVGPGLGRYLRRVGEGEAGKETLWGKRGNFSDSGESTRASYGSVVGFYASELDPEDSLSGFLNRVPLGLRRWACYPMLLGRVRRNFKHTLIIDVRNSLLLSDPFGPVRNRSTESVHIWPESEPESTRTHGRRNSGGGSSCSTEARVNSGVILGGIRGIRRFVDAALTEIVRGVIEHKGKTSKGRNSVTESGLVNQLIQSGHLLKNINLIKQTESIPNASQLTGFHSLDSSEPGFLAFGEYFPIVQRGSRISNGIVDIDDVIRKEICWSHGLYSSVYRDCLASQ